eukprot:624832-Rhodomonas_salina.1
MREGSKYMIIASWVDDSIVAENWDVMFQKLRTFLHKRFETQKLGFICWYLGVHYEFNADRSVMVATQKAYLEKLFDSYGITTAVKTLMEETFKIKQEDIPKTVDLKIQAEYRELLGSEIFLAGWSRPDITFPVITLAQYAANPPAKALAALKRVLRYLYGTQDLGIGYTSDVKGMRGLKLNELGTYVDTSHADDLITRKSTMGYQVWLNRGVISWRTKLTPIVCTSTTDAEYVSACFAAMETIHLQQLMAALGFPQEHPTQ